MVRTERVTFTMDDRRLIDRLIALEMTEKEARALVQIAREQRWSIQKTYFLTEGRILKLDMIMAIILGSFIGFLAVHEVQSALTAIFIFGLLMIMMEIVCRFHKDYLKKITTFLRLKGM
ncbi:hypothetical protein [Trabulsiella odontotermitis]|uniref:hypothetical protein n=1 Tax=Trabulsiella odontotermitis TaxID=379893 RepID=UPI0012D771DE|nr:hypothetical protein [Trabulsiella odontotermitis]